MTLRLDEHAITDQTAAPGLVENPCCWALEALAAHVPHDHAIVELGAYKGRTTGWLALGSHKGNHAPVNSIDPHDQGHIPRGYADRAPSVAEYVLSETRQAYLTHLERTGIRPLVNPIQATAVDAATNYSGPPVGLLWHDALHRASDVAADLKAWLPHMAKEAVIILHDTDDPRLGVAEGARRALTGTKKARNQWAWDGRIVHPWPKNEGKPPEARRRGFTIVHTRVNTTYPVLSAPITRRIV